MNLYQVSKSTFKAKAFELMRNVERSGASLLITHRGKPTMELRLYRSPSIDPLTALRGTLIRYDEPLSPVSVEWEAEDR